MNLNNNELSDESIGVQELSQKRTVLFLVGFGVIFSAVTLLLLQYSTYTVTVVGIKVKDTLGLASIEEHRHLAKICVEIKDLDCAEASYRAMANGTDMDSKKDAGRFLFLSQKHNDSLYYYSQYFNMGGQDLDASFDYARLLSMNGEKDRASEYFLKVIEAKADVMQYTVAESYVEHLLKYNETGKAKEFIKKWRSKGDNTSQFLEVQWRKVASNN